VSLARLESEATGVGNSETTVRRSGPPEPCRPGPFVSLVRGVGSRPREDEDPLAAVRGANVRRSNTSPFRIEPRRGKVGEDSCKSATNEGCDVLKEHESGSKYAQGTGDVGPDPAVIVFSKS
jgi:hypothetical protein